MDPYQLQPGMSQLDLTPNLQYIQPGIMVPPTVANSQNTMFQTSMALLHGAIRELTGVVRGTAGYASSAISGAFSNMPRTNIGMGTPINPMLTFPTQPGAYISTGPMTSLWRGMTGFGRPETMSPFEYQNFMMSDFAERFGTGAAMIPVLAPGVAGMALNYKAWFPAMRGIGAAFNVPKTAEGFGAIAAGLRNIGGVGMGLIENPSTISTLIPRLGTAFRAGMAGGGALALGMNALSYPLVWGTTQAITGMTQQATAENFLRQTDWRILPGQMGVGAWTPERASLAGQMTGIGAEIPFYQGGFNRVMQVARGGMQAGLFNYTRDAGDFANRLRDLSKMSVQLTEILQTSLDDSMRILGRLQQQGFTGGTKDLQQAAWNLRLYGKMAGMTPTEMLEMQQVGVEQYRQFNFPIRAGATVAATTTAQVAAAIRGGIIPANVVEQAGGALALTQGIIASQTQFLGSNVGRGLMAAAWNPQTGGLTQGAFQNIVGGGMNLPMLGAAAGMNLADPRNALRFMTGGYERAAGQVQGMGATTAMLSTAFQGAQMTFGALGPEAVRNAAQGILERNFNIPRPQAQAMMQMVQGTNVEQINRQLETIRMQEQINQVTRGYWRGVGEDIIRPYQRAIYSGIQRPAAELREMIISPITTAITMYAEKAAGVVPYYGMSDRELANTQIAMQGIAQTGKVKGIPINEMWNTGNRNFDFGKMTQQEREDTARSLTTSVEQQFKGLSDWATESLKRPRGRQLTQAQRGAMEEFQEAISNKDTAAAEAAIAKLKKTQYPLTLAGRGKGGEKVEGMLQTLEKTEAAVPVALYPELSKAVTTSAKTLSYATVQEIVKLPGEEGKRAREEVKKQLSEQRILLSGTDIGDKLDIRKLAGAGLIRSPELLAIAKEAVIKPGMIKGEKATSMPWGDVVGGDPNAITAELNWKSLQLLNSLTKKMKIE